jgi:hypothetical protein
LLNLPLLLLLPLFLRWRRPPKPAKPAPSTGLKALADAANEAAKRQATRW